MSDSSPLKIHPSAVVDEGQSLVTVRPSGIFLIFVRVQLLEIAVRSVKMYW